MKDIIWINVEGTLNQRMLSSIWFSGVAMISRMRTEAEATTLEKISIPYSIPSGWNWI
jgi:hypothetical protein